MTKFEVELDKIARVKVDVEIARIPEGVRFVDWVEELAQDRTDPKTGRLLKGLRIDGKRFDLTTRPAMRWIYEQMPSTREEAAGKRLTLMKCSQVGFTVMEMLWAIFFALKYEPISLGFFLPDATLARTKSSERFMPIMRSIPSAHGPLLAAQMAASGVRGEGNVMTRRIGGSFLRFLWTTGRATTESYPMDVVSFDEVQEMLIPDMEKVLQRLSASDLKFVLMGSTANWPESDIHHWYLQGTQHRFHTRCPTCGREEPLDAYFPDCIGWDPGQVDPKTGQPGAYRYRCREGHWVDDPQLGEWRAERPDLVDRGHVSIHFHQMLSPTVSPREIFEGYINASDAKNFHNRVLGQPYQDRSQLPVTLEHLNKCAAEGMALGLEWKTHARGTYMGVDQMGAHNVVIIKERLPDGRQAVVHLEEIYAEDPFGRCDELMQDYGVQVCVVETNPNYNDAHRFAGRFPGRVFLANYGDLGDDAIRWGDGPRLDRSESRTSDEERTRYTVTLDQYKCMSLSLARLVNTHCLFPDPQAWTQEIVEKGVSRVVAVLKDRAFIHFQKTALVTERIHEDERNLRRRVKKVGLDPHFSYANMLCDVAWARAHGTASFIFPHTAEPTDGDTAREVMKAALPPEARQLIEAIEFREGTCGACEECPIERARAQGSFFCKVQRANCNPRDPGCYGFVARAP